MRIGPGSIRKCCWPQESVDISDWMFVMSLTMLADYCFSPRRKLNPSPSSAFSELRFF